MESPVSVSDVAVGNDGEKDDQLETRGYAQTLSDFILECQTPLTIGVQGEWGSGKTSLINMVEGYLEATNDENRGDRIYSLQINTWEHSLLQTPEGTLLSIIQEIIDNLIDKNKDKEQNKTKWKQEFGSVMRSLAGSAAWVGLAAVGGTAVLNAARQEQANARDLRKDDEPVVRENIIKKLREKLRELTTTIKSQPGNFDRFVIFIDDLDRLEPPVAVAVLELLKNIFNIPHTVFVLAIDYQVVVKGLKDKFGELTPDNEREFRSFFDKIIQVPFMMPMANYKLETYVKHLLEQIRYFKSELQEDELVKLTKVVRQTIGRNPRSLKRLTNSLALIALQNKEELKDTDKRKLLFSMVCFQIGFPNVFEILLLQPNFPEWTEEGAFRFIRSKGKNPNPKNFDQEWEAIAAGSDDVFEDTASEEESEAEWQKALFRVVWVMDWQKTRVTETAEVLKNIYEEFIEKKPDDAQDLLKDVLRLAGTTSVISWDTTSSSEEVDQDAVDARTKYWKEFYEKVVDTPFVTEGKKMRTAGHASWRFFRKDPELDNLMKWESALSSTNFLHLRGKGPKAKAFLEYLQQDVRRIIKKESFKAEWYLKDDAEGYQVMKIYPNDLQKKLQLHKESNADQKAVAFKWLEEEFRPLRNEILKYWQKFENKNITNEDEPDDAADNEGPIEPKADGS